MLSRCSVLGLVRDVLGSLGAPSRPSTASAHGQGFLVAFLLLLFPLRQKKKGGGQDQPAPPIPCPGLVDAAVTSLVSAAVVYPIAASPWDPGRCPAPGTPHRQPLVATDPASPQARPIATAVGDTGPRTGDEQVGGCVRQQPAHASSCPCHAGNAPALRPGGSWLIKTSRGRAEDVPRP